MGVRVCMCVCVYMYICVHTHIYTYEMSKITGHFFPYFKIKSINIYIMFKITLYKVHDSGVSDPSTSYSHRQANPIRE